MKYRLWIAFAVLVLCGYWFLRPEPGARQLRPASGRQIVSAQISNDSPSGWRLQRESRPLDPANSNRLSSPSTSDLLSSRQGLKRRIDLTSSSTLLGRTVDSQGQPVAGVTLELSGGSGEAKEAHRPEFTTQSDSDGSFRFILPNRYEGWLWAHAGGYLPVRESVWSAGPGEIRKVVVLSQASGSLRVSVTELISDRRVSGARVGVRLEEEAPGLNLPEYECWTDSLGKCRLENLPLFERLVLTASRSGSFEDIRRFELQSDSPRDMDLGIVSGPTMRIQVLDPDGQPIQGARIVRPDGISSRTDTEGEVEIPVIQELQAVHVTISASGFRTAEEALPNTSEPQTIVLQPAPILFGTVNTTRDHAVAAAAIQISHSGRLLEEVLSDRDGNFALPLPQDSALLLRADRMGFHLWEEEFPDQESFPEELEIRLQPYASLVSGQILDERGVPLDQAQVVFTPVSRPGRGKVSRRADLVRGGYLIGDLPAGAYEIKGSGLRAESSGVAYFAGTRVVDIRSRGHQQFDLNLLFQRLSAAGRIPQTRPRGQH